MDYIDYEYYKVIYGDIPEADFNRLSWEAFRKMDVATTGLGNVKKLKVAFPTDEEDAEAVRRCAGALVSELYKLQQAEESARSAQGYIQHEDGSLQGKVVSSVSAGNESISYSVNGSSGSKTAIDQILSDKAAQEQYFNNIIIEYLSGIADSNGVNLLYMGQYPYRLENHAGT